MVLQSGWRFRMSPLSSMSSAPRRQRRFRFLPHLTTRSLGPTGSWPLPSGRTNPRLKYRINFRDLPSVVETGVVPSSGASYPRFEVLQAAVPLGDNHALFQVEYGGSHVYISEIVAWWRSGVERSVARRPT